MVDTHTIQSLDNVSGGFFPASPQEFNIFAGVHHRGAGVYEVHLYGFVAYGNYTRAVGHKTLFAYSCGAGIELNGVFGNSIDKFFHF